MLPEGGELPDAGMYVCGHTYIRLYMAYARACMQAKRGSKAIISRRKRSMDSYYLQEVPTLVLC